MPATAPAVQADQDRIDGPEQLELRLFERIGAMRGAPPERALWRESLDLAIGNHAAVNAPDGRPVDASTLWAVGWTFYALGNSAGIINGVNVETVARYCRISARHVKAARAILRNWHVIKVERPSRRKPEVVKLNLGGLDWPAVRRRAAAERRRLRSPSGDTLPPLNAPSGDTMSLLDTPSGDTLPPLNTPSGDKVSPPEGCTYEESSSSKTHPTDRQLRGIRSMGNELRGANLDPVGCDDPKTRAEADVTFRERKRQVTALREKERKRTSGRSRPDQTGAGWDASKNSGRVRNCPSCRTHDRSADCHCMNCGWRESGCTCEFDVDAKRLG